MTMLNCLDKTVAKNILTIEKIHNDRFTRIAEGLAWLIRYCKNDIVIKANTAYTIRVLDLTDDIKISYAELTKDRRLRLDGFKQAADSILVTRNEGANAGVPVLIGTECLPDTKRESLGKIINEFELFYDEECEDEIAVVEYNEVVEEIVDEIYGLASLHKMEIYS